MLLFLLAAGTLSVDTSRSSVVVNVFKAGLASAALHDHRISPDTWSGTVTLDPDHPESATVELSIDATSLHDHETKLSAADRKKVDAETQANVLDTAKFPSIAFHGTRFEPQAGSAPGHWKGSVDGTLDLHGVSKAVAIPVVATMSNGELHVTGSVSFAQTGYGIKPIYKAFGAIQVKDEVRIDLDVIAVPATKKADRRPWRGGRRRHGPPGLRTTTVAAGLPPTGPPADRPRRGPTRRDRPSPAARGSGPASSSPS